IWSTSGAIALTCSVIDRKSRRVGDLLAGTMVIQERMRDLSPQRVAVPDSLQDWVHGADVGRLAMGTRVVRDDGGPVHVRQSLLRAVMAMLEIWSTSGAIALTCSVIDRKSRRVGDLLAGTMVIQERMRDLSPQRVAVPASLQDWVHGADVGRLPLTLMQDIRSFLPRATTINPESRRQLSRDLLRRTLPHVAPAPPPGTDPEQFLTAVIAERSRRDEARLRRAQERQEELAAEVRAVPFSA
ncbi:MAG: RDD family protein, partial [Actinomycetales bacterium]|nr:RDD family protein [Actinomycetales bacterium]